MYFIHHKPWSLEVTWVISKKPVCSTWRKELWGPSSSCCQIHELWYRVTPRAMLPQEKREKGQSELTPIDTSRSYACCLKEILSSLQLWRADGSPLHCLFQDTSLSPSLYHQAIVLFKYVLPLQRMRQNSFRNRELFTLASLLSHLFHSDSFPYLGKRSENSIWTLICSMPQNIA